jgi:hypothetical protein
MRPAWLEGAPRKWQFWVAVIALIVITVANLKVAPWRLPFTKGNRDFNVAQMIESRRWVEAAPVVLTNHFRKVTVTNTGDRFKEGFGFERELVGIFGVAAVHRKNNPVDVRDRLSAAQLAPFSQYKSTVHCSGRTSKYCGFQIYWNPKRAPRDVTFVGVLTKDNAYGLIESGLLKQLLGGN